jgi:2-(1,2-epoxy-1,2-dihydrophenyl)acetyl-CoA isomerase
MTEYTTVEVTIAGPGVSVITLDGPHRRNALAHPTMLALDSAVARVFEDDSVRAVVLTGAGGFFSAGGDLKSPRTQGRGVGAPATRLGVIQHTLDMLHRRPKPVIAAVEGGAVGVGWSLVLSCDLVIAAADAYFLAPFTERGLVPDGGIAWFLVRALGRQRAARLLMLPERLPALHAAELGLVNEIVPNDAALDAAVALADRLAAGPPDALALTKRLLHAAEGTPSYRDFLDREWTAAALAMHGPDLAEGIAAFTERRPPDFGNDNVTGG